MTGEKEGVGAAGALKRTVGGSYETDYRSTLHFHHLRNFSNIYFLVLYTHIHIYIYIYKYYNIIYILVIHISRGTNGKEKMEREMIVERKGGEMKEKNEAR